MWGTNDPLAHSQQTNQLQFNQAHSRIDFEIIDFPSQLLPYQQRSQPQLNEASQSEVDPSNSQQITSGGERYSQQPQLNHADQSQVDQSYSLQCVGGGVRHSEATRHPQLNQGEPSQDLQQIKSGSGKIVSDEEREKKRQSCRNYRERKRIAEIERQKVIDSLKRQNDSLKEQKDSLEKQLAMWNRSSQESIPCPEPNRQLPAQARQSKLRPIHHPSLSAPEERGHHGTNSEEFDQIRADDHRQYLQASTSWPQVHGLQGIDNDEMDSGALGRSDDWQMNNDIQHAQRRISSAHLAENQENFGAGITPVAQLLEKINGNRKSNADVSHFKGLESGEKRVTIGRYSVPISLQPAAEKIIEHHGDVTENSKMPFSVDESIYILFCATVKDMEDHKLDQVTDDKILKWSDTINDALRINFRVRFAMDHLKHSIVPAHIGRVEEPKLDKMAARISTLKADLAASEEEYDKKRSQSQQYKDAFEKLKGKSVDTGLFG